MQNIANELQTQNTSNEVRRKVYGMEDVNRELKKIARERSSYYEKID